MRRFAAYRVSARNPTVFYYSTVSGQVNRPLVTPGDVHPEHEYLVFFSGTSDFTLSISLGAVQCTICAMNLSGDTSAMAEERRSVPGSQQGGKQEQHDYSASGSRRCLPSDLVHRCAGFSAQVRAYLPSAGTAPRTGEAFRETAMALWNHDKLERFKGGDTHDERHHDNLKSMGASFQLR